MGRSELSSHIWKGLLIILITLSTLCTISTDIYGFAGGSGEIDDPYLVETAEHLNQVRNHLTAHFRQIADIDLTEYLSPGGGGYNNGLGWEPIGIFSYYDPEALTGSYDGDGFEISNLVINREGELYEYIALFSYVNEGGQLKNIKLVDVNINGYYAAPLAGIIKGDVLNCSATGVVNGYHTAGLVYIMESHNYINRALLSNSYSHCSVNGVDGAAGLVAFIAYTIVEHSYSTGFVRSYDGSAGGLINGSDMESIIEYSFTSGEILSTGLNAAGLVGGTNATTINESYATGNVTLQNSSFMTGNCGGLVGSGENSQITNSYATGTLSVTGAASIGGLVGLIGLDYTIEKSYSAGRVTSGPYSGGLVGNQYYTNYVSWCYWDIYTSGQVSSEFGEGKLTPEMLQQDTFIDWDFTEIWEIEEGDSYPYLRNNLPEVIPSPPERTVDLGALTLMKPEILYIDMANTIRAVIFNMGSAPQENFTVRLMKEGDVEIDSVVVNELLEQYEQIEIELIWSPDAVEETYLWAEVILTGDEYPANDLSGELPVRTYTGFDGGEGTETSPYLISQAEQFLLIKYFLDAHYELTADVDLSSFQIEGVWEPLGYYINEERNLPFTGRINGNNHIISNISITGASYFGSDIGFINYLGEEGILENLILQDITINNWFVTGGLVGRNEGTIRNSEVINIYGYRLVYAGGLVGENHGVIENCAATFELHSLFSNSRIGGLVAYNYGMISSSHSTVEFTGGYITGGLVSHNYETGVITDSYSAGSISECNIGGGVVGYNLGEISNSYANCYIVDGLENIGGLVGWNYNLIENCYNRGIVTGEYRVAGIAGKNQGTIRNSYNQGYVEGIGQIGGLAGWSLPSGIIENSYSSGMVTGVDMTGGLIGQNFGSVLNSYWDIESSGQYYSDGGSGRTTAEMMQQLTYQDWNFTDIWQIIEEESYPYLFYEEDPVNLDEEELVIPITTELIGNYPNPFNPETTILFRLAEPGRVKMEIFNIKGQRVRVLLDEILAGGDHQVIWNGRDEQGIATGSGVYFYRLTAQGQVDTRKMLLLK